MVCISTKRPSVRLIIMQAQRVLVGSYSEVVLVCMYVCLPETGLRLKYTGLRIVSYLLGTCCS